MTPQPPPNGQALIVRPHTLLAARGSRRELRELEARIRSTYQVQTPNGPRAMADIEARQIATLCLAHRLVENEDVKWYIDRRGKFCVHMANSAWQKATQRAIDAQGGGTYWIEYRRLDDPQERIRLGLSEGMIGYEARLYDSPTLRAWQETIKAQTDALIVLAKIGVGAKDAGEALARDLAQRPYTSGIGFYKPGTIGAEADYLYSPEERAKKRAAKQALQKRFTLDLPDESDGELGAEFTGAMRDDQPQAIESSAPPSPAENAAIDAQIIEGDRKPKPTAAARNALWQEQ